MKINTIKGTKTNFTNFIDINKETNKNHKI